MDVGPSDQTTLKPFAFSLFHSFNLSKTLTWFQSQV
jgi:hypothetical protein